MLHFLRGPIPWILAAALAAAGTLVSAHQQTPQQPRQTFRAGVDLVQVDVVVLDADGNPVHGLTKDDFVLIDGNLPQPIATFAELIHDRPPAQVFPPGLPLDVASNQSAKSDRLVMLVLDDLHFRGRTEEAKSLVRQVVSGLEGGASLGLVTTSGTFGVEITEDRERLLLEINNFLDHFDPHVGETPNTPVVNAMGTTMRDPGPERPGVVLQRVSRIQDRRRRRADDGRERRAPQGDDPDFRGHREREPDRHRDASAEERTRSVFWRGRGSADYTARCSAVVIVCHQSHALRRPQRHVRRAAPFERRRLPVDPGGPKDHGASLDPVARETGGFAVHANDLEAGMASLLADLDNYYLLGFYPADPKDKKYHPLDVRVNRPGLTVRHRHGYQPGGPPPPPKNDKPLEQLVAPVMPKTDLPLRLGAVPLFGSGSKMQVLATLEVGVEAPAGAATPLVSDTIEFAIYAADLKKKKVTVSDARRLDVQWTVETGEVDGIVPRAERSLARPRAVSTARVRDVEDARQDRQRLSADRRAGSRRRAARAGRDRADAGHTGQTTPGVLHTAALQGVSLPFAPALTRAFTEADDVRVFCQVRRASAATAVTGTAAIVGTDGVERLSVPWTLGPSGASNIDLTLPLAGIAAGPYRLVVKASDGVHQADREVGIRVE